MDESQGLRAQVRVWVISATEAVGHDNKMALLRNNLQARRGKSYLCTFIYLDMLSNTYSKGCDAP